MSKTDLANQFTRLSKSDVERFCTEIGIPLSFNPTVPKGKTPVTSVPTGKVAVYTRQFDQGNLRYPFSTFFLNVLEYHRLSLDQLCPSGVARILHFEIVCRCLGHKPSLAMYRRFFRLAKNGNWFTIEKTQCEPALISSVIGIVSSWKDKFFFLNSDFLPFKTPRRSSDAPLNEKEPEPGTLDQVLLEKLRGFPTRLRTFPEDFLVMVGLSANWHDLGTDPVIYHGGKGRCLPVSSLVPLSLLCCLTLLSFLQK